MGLWILIGILAIMWIYMVAVLLHPAFEALGRRLRVWRAHRRLVEMTTPLGRLRVGLDSPDLMTREARRRH
jgi:hypothetical protein